MLLTTGLSARQSSSAAQGMEGAIAASLCNAKQKLSAWQKAVMLATAC